MFTTSRQNPSDVSAPRLWGAIRAEDWQQATLADGQSVGGLLRAHGLPATRNVLAALAQANSISDFRHLAAGTALWIPTAELLSGERASVWRAASAGISPDGFAAVDQDRVAARSVQAPAPRGPVALAAPSNDRAPVSIPAQRPTPPPTTPGERLAPNPATVQRLSGLAGQLAQELHGRKDRDAILRLTYQLMSSHEWTNADARLAYARAAGAPNDPWKIIRDIRAAQGLTITGNGFSRRDGLHASEFVFNDESTPYDGQISPAMRAVFAAIGLRDRGFGRLDAAFGTATVSLEDALWDIVNTTGVAQANAIIATRAGMPGGITANLKSDDGPIDGHLEAPARGQNPLEHLIDAEYGNIATRAMQGFQSIDRERLKAILRQPRGMDRAAFDKALQASTARGEDFLKLFQTTTEAQNEIIAASYQATYGVSLVSRARTALTAGQFQRYAILQRGVKSDPKVATAYVQASAPVVKPKERPAILALAPNTYIRRSGLNADNPAALATRIMTSTDAGEIAGCLKRTDGLPWSGADLVIMNRAAAEYDGSSPDTKPSALLKHVAQITGMGSPSTIAVEAVGGANPIAVMYDEDGRLSPAAQLFYALYMKDNDEISDILAGSTVIDLSTIQRDYPAVARELAAKGVAAPGNATTAKAAIQAVMRGDERTRALSFMNALDVTSLDAAGQSGSAIAAAVTKDLNSRCAWLLREFDHEREPLRDRLMQFEVTLGEVLTAVQERREREGQAVNLTDDEQIALGNAVRSLVGAQTAFANEREALAHTAQDTTILIATIVASTTLTVGSAGFGAPAGAALLATATNIGRVAAVGAAAGLITAPLQGGNHPYITSVARGGAWGAFAGLGASTGWMHSALAKIMPGTGVIANTARNVVIMGTTSGGLSGVRDIGKTYDSPEEQRAAIQRDVLHGVAAGAGFAVFMGATAGLQQWGNAGLQSSANAAPAVASGTSTQVATRLQNEATRLASRPITTPDATEYYVRLARLSEMEATLGSLQQQGASAELLQQTASKIAASRASLDTALAGRVRDIFVQARTQATPAQTAAVLQQFRGAFVEQGFAEAAPRTMSELNAVARSLKL